MCEAGCFKDHGETLSLPWVWLEYKRHVYLGAGIYPPGINLTGEVFHLERAAILSHSHLCYPGIDGNRSAFRLHARGKHRSRVSVSERFEANDFRPDPDRIFQPQVCVNLNGFLAGSRSADCADIIAEGVDPLCS